MSTIDVIGGANVHVHAAAGSDIERLSGRVASLGGGVVVHVPEDIGDEMPKKASNDKGQLHVDIHAPESSGASRATQVDYPVYEECLSPVTQLKHQLKGQVMLGELSEDEAHKRLRSASFGSGGSGLKMVDRMLNWALSLKEVHDPNP